MSRFTSIDLAAYPVGDVLEVLDFESYLARDKADFLARWNARRQIQPELPALDLEALDVGGEPINFLLQTGSFRELLLRGRINDRIRNVTLAGARGRALDHIGVTYYRSPRLVVAPADPIAGTAERMEADEVYRQRLAVAPEAWSTAGPEGAYVFFGYTASGEVLDLAVYSEDDGVCLAPEVQVVLLSRVGDGTASPELLATVRTALRRKDIRPLADLVTVRSAEPLPFNVHVTLKVDGGASKALVVEAATHRITDYTSGRRRWAGDGEEGPIWLVGRTLRQDTIAAAGFVPGVAEVVVNDPPADVNAPAGGGSTAHLFKAPRIGAVTIVAEDAP